MKGCSEAFITIIRREAVDAVDAFIRTLLSGQFSLQYVIFEADQQEKACTRAADSQEGLFSNRARDHGQDSRTKLYKALILVSQTDRSPNLSRVQYPDKVGNSMTVLSGSLPMNPSHMIFHVIDATEDSFTTVVGTWDTWLVLNAASQRKDLVI